MKKKFTGRNYSTCSAPYQAGSSGTVAGMAVKIFFLQAIFVFVLSGTLHAQRRGETLTARDTSNINYAAQGTLREFFSTLNLLAHPTTSEKDREELISDCFDKTKIFYNEDFLIDDDTYPTKLNAASCQKEPVRKYLGVFQSRYNPNETEIDYNIVSIWPVKRNPGGTYVTVVYRQHFKGKAKEPSVAGKTYAQNYRIAVMIVNKVGTEWKAYISSLKFWDNSQVDNGANNVVIAADNTARYDEEKSEDYYEQMLQKGVSDVKQGKYADAWVNLSEAKKSKDAKKTKIADAEMTKLKGLVISATGKPNIDEYMHRELKAKAKDFSVDYKFDKAKMYYEYALTFSLTDNSITKAINDINDKIGRQRALEQLYNTGLYQKAIEDYTKEIEQDGKNTNLYLGRAMCYQKLALTADPAENEKKAETDFLVAIKLDPTNLEAYKSRAMFFKQKKNPDFDKAYASYVSYTNNAEVNDPSLPAIQSDMTFCKGMKSYQAKSYNESLDSFKSAIATYRNNKEAWLYSGLSARNLKDDNTARRNIEEAIKIDAEYAEAHYYLGKLWETYNVNKNEDHTDEAIKEIKTALSLSENNPVWHFDLGEILLAKGDRIYLAGKESEKTVADKYALEADQCFTKCIDLAANQSDARLKGVAHWKRGLCRYYRGNFREAYDDYKLYPYPTSSFYVDYGNTCIRLGRYEEAIQWYEKVNSAESYLGRAVANFNMNKEYYTDLEKAFRQRIGRGTIENGNFVGQLADTREFKKLKKEYGYK